MGAEEKEYAQYSVLSRAQLSFEYLHTNSTTHEFLFGALAELLDNARDASATKINIYTVPDDSLRGGYMLCFLDDGDGMDPSEAANIITFGKSTKRVTDSQMIGQYGNGLKSGSMRIGSDFILFTKKAATMTCLMMSRTFHEEEKIEEVIVPLPSFDSQSKRALGKAGKALEKHKLEMDLIYKYSPFHTHESFMRSFDSIRGGSGTLVIIYNLKLMDNGQPELDVMTGSEDILLSQPHTADFDMEDGLMPERKSFRAYTAILYADPRMRIYVQNVKVRTERLVNCLYRPRMYKYASSRFKTRSEIEVKKAKHNANVAEEKAREAESKAKALEHKHSATPTSKDARVALRKAQSHAHEVRREANLKKELAERKQKSLKEPKTLNFVFGLNLENRSQDGMFVYNCSRLIKMYQRVGPQLEGNQVGGGVMGIVDVPYLVLEPTHNKQDFADGKEYRHLKKAMGEYMMQYWTDIDLEDSQKLWESYGYLDKKWYESPSDDQKYVKKRNMQVSKCVQCDECLKWRILPFSSKDVGQDLPDYWVCSMNIDTQHNRCSSAEERSKIAEGVLKIKHKTAEDKKQELTEEIRKKQEKLEKLQHIEIIKSAAQVRHAERARTSAAHDVNYRETPARSGSPSKKGRVSSSHHSYSSHHHHRRGLTPRKHSKTMSSDSEDDEEEEVLQEEVLVPDDEPEEEEVEEEEQEAEERVEQRAQKRMKEEESSASAAAPAKRKRDAHEREPVLQNLRDAEDSRPLSPASFQCASPRGTEKEPASSSEESNGAEVGKRVEFRINSRWYAGEVVKVNKPGSKLKVKFDKYKKDKYDKWIDRTCPDLKITSEGRTDFSNESPASVGSHDTTQETPSSSTAISTAPGGSSVADELAKGYRRCLGFFIPPEYMDKDSIYNMNTQELVSFPLDEFFDHYEKGLKGLVGKFQEQRDEYRKQADGHQTKLAELRTLMSKLLVSHGVLKANEIPDDIDSVFRKFVHEKVASKSK